MKRLSFILGIVLFMSLASAAHYIVGYTESGADGTNVNGKRVQLWNPSNAESLTSIIGSMGPSGTDDIYMFDCEMLPSSCNIGDILSVKILEDNDNRTGLNTINVTVTGAGFDAVVGNLTTNSPPNVSNEFPESFGNVSGTVDFNCSATDLDSNLENVYLYGNWSGWHLNDSAAVSGAGGSAIFSKFLSEGTYQYYCRAKDELDIYSEDDVIRQFNVDLTDPVINSISYNDSSICGLTNTVRVTCAATDAFTGVSNVSIDVNGTNYSASYLSGNDYYVDVLLDEVGNWTVDCYVQDRAGNIGGLSGDDLYVRDGGADFRISSINFSNNDPLENVEVLINATVQNVGCSDGGNVLIGLYSGDPDQGNSLSNQTTSILADSFGIVTFSWTSIIGDTNFFVRADNNESFSEANESDNELNRTLTVDSWQEFYGNVSSDKLIGAGFSNMSLWEDGKPISGNIFIVDKESQIDWVNLQAIGRNITGGVSSGDFGEIDTALGMSGFEDSVSYMFSGAPTKTFSVHEQSINNVPIINSTTNSIFKTGILWDVSDDSNGEYDSSENEDIVFVTEVNTSTQGTYGVYDYEINVPVRIRSLDPTDETEIYFYYDLN